MGFITALVKRAWYQTVTVTQKLKLQSDAVIEFGDGTTMDTAASAAKEYTALLSQTGTAAPTAVVIKNTLGGTLVWSRDTEGNYFGTLTGAFPNNKVYCQNQLLLVVDSATTQWSTVSRYDNNRVMVISRENNVAADGLLSSMPIRILVYP